jgi:hypothetical protein
LLGASLVPIKFLLNGPRPPVGKQRLRRWLRDRRQRTFVPLFLSAFSVSNLTLISQLLDFDDDEPAVESAADMFAAPSVSNSTSNPLDGAFASLTLFSHLDRTVLHASDLLGLFGGPPEQSLSPPVLGTGTNGMAQTALAKSATVGGGGGFDDLLF